MEKETGLHAPHDAIRGMLAENGLAPEESGGKRRGRIRYERMHSPLRHTDYKQLDDGRRFLRHEDDASRFVAWRGAFKEATTENAMTVPEGAVKRHGNPPP